MCIFFLIFKKLLLIFWLHWVFVVVHWLTVVVASRCGALALGAWALVVAAHGLSSCGTRALERAGSVVVAHGLSCSVACGIFPDEGSNPCPLHGQMDS